MIDTTQMVDITRISDLPTLPALLQRLLSMLEDPKVHNQDLARAVTYDPTLAARVLKMANSSYYSLPNPITGIANAVGILGRATLQSLVMTACCADIYKQASRNPYLPRQELWRHSVGVALLAKHIGASVGGLISREECYLAGLLHDVGKIALDTLFPADYEVTCRIAYDDDCPLLEAEQRQGSATHPEIGALLARHWQLPESIAAAIRWHHEPVMIMETTRLPAVIHAADVLCHVAMGTATPGLAIDPQVRHVLQLNDNLIQRLMNTLQIELQIADAFLSLGS